ncbi:hypothetical protein Lal_00047370 [Lupinus albus]|nr:hypothetical protein Lal_00047370 [Lupinus albus]
MDASPTPHKNCRSKWRWRLLFERDSLWVKVLQSRYGEGIFRGDGFGDHECSRRGSSWWRDIGNLSHNKVSVGNGWLDNGLRRRLGSGRDVSFWSDLWVGQGILKILFARLFQVTNDKDASVSSMGEWKNGVWIWKFVWEQEEYGKLIKFLRSYGPQVDAIDGWIWIHNKDGQYSVSNAYKVLAHEEKNVDFVIFKKLWKCNVPPKMKCLEWKIFLGGVPTKLCLAQRRVLEANVVTYCGLCGEEDEAINHLFFTCAKSYHIWQHIYSRFGLSSIIFNDAKVNFSSHISLLCLEKKSLSKWMSLWFITIWTIWNVMNKITFENSQFQFKEVIDFIFIHSWNTLSARDTAFKFSYLEWVSNPLLCLSSC